MKVALVHDYLNEFGGAERVLQVLSEIYPGAPIYTAFYRRGSAAYEEFKDRQIITSWAQSVPLFAKKLHSPLRFLAPQIWNSLDLSGFDVVVSSASWYITKGLRKGRQAIEICYCHTPPRYLYGYETSLNWRKYRAMRAYAGVVNKGLRQYDFEAAQRVDWFVANSKNVQARIRKFYRREATVVYPPVEIKRSSAQALKRSNYFLVLSRLVGGKGLTMAVEAANQLRIPLKVAGVGGGYGRAEQTIKAMAGPTVEFLGFVPDEKLAELYGGAKAFLALAQDEDFGITPLEAMMAGTPVVAYGNGGYLETVLDGKTGILFKEYSVAGLVEAIKKIQDSRFKILDIRNQAQKFSKERFVKDMSQFVEEKWEAKCKSN